ncbi:MAG: peptidoglycan DD-metalloendopeptidase family protein, partial [Bacteroidales bacterium]|nr:peptidoglycan DD-metalloendopeptidase family protein [Bacteroidales bacterium]
LGNVRAVVAADGTDANIYPDLAAFTDFYPFGMPMPDRTYTSGILSGAYRFGYQGQFAEKDPETGYNQFEARLYDSRIGRWMIPDPAGQYWSPYLGMGNNWISGVDPDGEYSLLGATWRMLAWGGRDLMHNKKNGEWGFTLAGDGEDGSGLRTDFGTEIGENVMIHIEKGSRPTFGPKPGVFPLNLLTNSYMNSPARFGDSRSNGRKHAGCDLYAPVGTEIRAIKNGVVIRNPSVFYRGTYSIEINHGNFIGRYCELKPIQGLVLGSEVTKGQVIGTVEKLHGIDQSMLHFEMYSGHGDGPLTNKQNLPYQRRNDLTDPTNFLNRLNH